MKENVAKMGSGNTSGTQTRKVFFSDLCCVDNMFAVNYSISHLSDLTDLWLAETSQTINVYVYDLCVHVDSQLIFAFSVSVLDGVDNFRS